MDKSVRSSIQNVLEDLTDDELKRFKAHLREYRVKPEYNNIPRGRLHNADALDLSDLLVSFYPKNYAAEVTAGVLRAINCLPQAERLEWMV